jgi:chorismate-pyruvate lyase
MTVPPTDPSLRELFELFRDQPTRIALAPPEGYTALEPPACEFVSADELPPDFRRLLAHENHMTLALEAFHGRPVKLHILAIRNSGNDYARMILLSLEGTDRIVEFGIVRLNLSFLSDDVRAEILAGTTPLGRVLIEHDVLRRITPVRFLKITPNEPMRNFFRMTTPEPIYGRLATILCEGVTAIDLLEVVCV